MIERSRLASRHSIVTLRRHDMKTKWFKDLTDGNSYRVNYFRHRTGRMMEEWVSLNGDRWYLEVGDTEKTVLRGHTLQSTDPIPGLLCRDLDLDWNK